MSRINSFFIFVGHFACAHRSYWAHNPYAPLTTLQIFLRFHLLFYDSTIIKVFLEEEKLWELGIIEYI